MARTVPGRCPSQHLGFIDIGLCHRRHVPQHLERLERARAAGLEVRPTADAMVDRYSPSHVVAEHQGHATFTGIAGLEDDEEPVGVGGCPAGGQRLLSTSCRPLAHPNERRQEPEW